MMKHIARLVSGNVNYSTPPMPVRGYDAPARAVQSDITFVFAPVNGAGYICGRRGGPDPALVAPPLNPVLGDANGAGYFAGTSALDGLINDPNFLANTLRANGFVTL